MTNITLKQILFLCLAILGGTMTWYHNLQLPLDQLSQFFTIAWSTPVGSSLMWDVIVPLMTWLVFMIPEVIQLKMNRWLILLIFITSFTIAFAFAFPLFMFFRERALAKQKLV